MNALNSFWNENTNLMNVNNTNTKVSTISTQSDAYSVLQCAALKKEPHKIDGWNK